MVESIWRYPVKSAQGESVTCARFGPDGPDGDRAFACLTADGIVVSAKNPRRWGRMLFVTATAVNDAGGDQVMVCVPGGEPLRAGTAPADEALSRWLGARVRLSSKVPPDARLHRLWPKEPGMIPEWARAAGAGREEITEIRNVVAGQRFVDFAAVHLVTTRALDELKREAAPTDLRRVRPNLVLSLDREPEPGDRIQVGPDLVLRILSPTPRCAIPAAEQPGLDHAPEVLRAIARRRREIPGLGRAACFGNYAQVLSPGTVRLGDTATIAA
ncbi:MAG TPA: MOSC domain-containing protein [Streptosporangiaceae bacterium]|nr:MOSC domain-containing protein [Streptosporangiaceae bacterium]